MKIGKTIQTVTSPPRRVQKAGQKPQEKPIPVEIPKKIEVESFDGFRLESRMYWMAMYNPSTNILDYASS